MTQRQPSIAHLTQRGRGLLTPLNLHFAGLAVLALVNLYLLIHMAVAWQAARSQDADAVARQTAALHAAEQASQPLRGLDGKLTLATANADRFAQQRLPFADSQVIAELGALAKRQNVRLVRVQYPESPVVSGSTAGPASPQPGSLTEIRMDANLTGDYRSLVLFMNSLERDRLFFLITGVALTGQQSGTVNLRIKITTYQRAPLLGESAQKTVALTASEPTP